MWFRVKFSLTWMDQPKRNKDKISRSSTKVRWGIFMALIFLLTAWQLSIKYLYRRKSLSVCKRDLQPIRVTLALWLPVMSIILIVKSFLFLGLMHHVHFYGCGFKEHYKQYSDFQKKPASANFHRNCWWALLWKRKKKGTGELYILEHKALRAVLHHFFCSTIRRFKLLWVKLAISGKMFKATRRMLKEFLRSSGTFTRLFLWYGFLIKTLGLV